MGLWMAILSSVVKKGIQVKNKAKLPPQYVYRSMNLSVSNFQVFKMLCR